MIEIRSTGLPNSVQDLGRRGHLAQGVARSGAMDVPALRVANALVGNADDAAVIEIALFPFRLRFERATGFACTGADSVVKLDGQATPPWWGRTAEAGQELVIDAPQRGARVYVAFAGGVDVPPVLGSRATDLKSGLGGVEGRGLRRGDKLALGVAEPTLGRRAGLGCLPPDLPAMYRQAAEGIVEVRVLPSAQYEDFASIARSHFTNTTYRVTPEANRMGFRLEGAPLERVRRQELFSHGIVPGTVQVPPSGQPIIQLADANTCGGYPKIANVIDADLWRLAQTRIGQRLRFTFVEPQEAVQALRAQELFQRRLRSNLALMAGRA